MATRRSTKSLPVEGAVSAAEALHFAAIADGVMRAPMHAAAQKRASAQDASVPHIGTLREKRLHAAVKAYLCPDESRHERPVGDLTLVREPTAEGEKTPRSRKMVADILLDGEIVEVQTGGFFPLREKVAWYLSHTTCRVTVVHPIAAVKYLSWIDPVGGDILSRTRSPKRGRVKDVARELYWLSDFIGDERFSLRILLLELEEYRMADGWSRDKKRGSSRYERFPTALLGDVTLRGAEDYATYFLPDALRCPDEAGCPVPFTAAQYARATGIRGKATYGLLRVLETLGLIAEAEEKIGRSRAYVARL